MNIKRNVKPGMRFGFNGKRAAKLLNQRGNERHPEFDSGSRKTDKR